MSPSLVSAEQKEQRQSVLEKKCKAEQPSRTGNDSNTVKTREPNKTSSVCLEFQRQKRKELVEKMCQRHQENDLRGKRSPCKEGKMPFTTTREQPSTSAKHTTSERSSNVSHKTNSSCTQQQMCSFASPLPLNFKIPKKVQSRPVDNTVESSDAISTNRNVRHGTELSNSGASVNNSKQETVKQAHSYLDVTPIFPCEGQDKRPSWSGQLPAMCNTDTGPWYDQVRKSISNLF